MTSVFLKIVKDGRAVIPKFPHCLVDLLNEGKTTAVASWKLEDDLLVLSPKLQPNVNNVDNAMLIEHANECPIRQATDNVDLIPLEKRNLNIPVAVCILLESSDNHILLTKRPSHMRSSPGLWVPPGGHLENGEELLEGGLRELREETGLDLTGEQINARILLAWENTYPIILGLGNPKAHMLVVYYHVRVFSSHQQLQTKIKIDPTEVAAYTWLSPFALGEIFNPIDIESYAQKQFVWEDNHIVETDLKYLSMYNRFVWVSKSPFSGVQSALLKWYSDYQSRQTQSKM